MSQEDFPGKKYKHGAQQQMWKSNFSISKGITDNSKFEIVIKQYKTKELTSPSGLPFNSILPTLS